VIRLEGPEQLDSLLGMPPPFSGASSERECVQGLIDVHVGLFVFSIRRPKRVLVKVIGE